MRPALDPVGHWVPRKKPTCLLHTWRPHRQRPFALVLHLHQHQSSRNLHLQYLAKNQSTQRCQSLITKGSDHPPVLEPHMVLKFLSKQSKFCQYKGCVELWGTHFIFRMAFEIQRKNSSKIQVKLVGYCSLGPRISPSWYQIFFLNSKPI
jgi:hypothetical protein